MVLVVPVFEVEQAGHYYNTAAVIDADGTVLGKYRKHHIPQVKGFWEKFYFRPGNLGWPVCDTAVGKVGVYICYDRHFPEGWRALGLAGAQIVYNPSATSRGLSSYLWKLEQPAAAVANEYFIAAINRVGVEEYGDNDFYGTSYFVDPRGQFVGEVASEHDEELVVRDLDLDLIDEVRQTVGVLPRPPPRRLRPAGGVVSGLHELAPRAQRRCLPSWLAIYYADPSRSTAARAATSGTATATVYLDFFGGILTTMTAHALPEVTKAVSEQAGRIIHSSTLYLNRPMVELAEQIATVSAIPDAKVFFTTSGTEANDAALLLASSTAALQPDPRAAQQLPRPVVLDGRDHGQPVVVARRRCRRSRRYYVHGGQPLPLAVRRAVATASSSPRASPTCARCSTRRAATSRRSSRSRSRASAGSPRAPDGLLGAFARGARASTASCGSPTRCRPDGAAPASTSGAGRPTAARTRT